MSSLIKQELFKMKKDKSLRVALIVTLALSIVGVLSNLLLNNVMKSIDESFVISAKLSISSIFSFTNNFGFILPIFIVVFLCKDFNYGTIRNRVIAGYSKSKIYVSHLMSSLMIGIGLLLINFIVISIMSVLLLKEGVTFSWLLKILGLGILVYVELISLVVFLSMISKNQSMAIIISMVVMFVGTIVVSILEAYSQTSWISDLLLFKHSTTLSSQGSFEMMKEYTLNNTRILKLVLSSLLEVVATTGLGIMMFKEKDLK